MKLSASLDRLPLDRLPLDRKDRRMLLVVFALVAVLLVVLAFVSPASDSNNPVPSTYAAGQHGAKAAFTLLQQTGYSVQRWEQPLSELAAHAGSDTVLVLAEPFSFQPDDRAAVAEILNKGGRILATGFQGGALLPGNELAVSKEVSFAACEAQPDGLEPLAGAGPIWIVPLASWKESRPEIHTAYTCAGQPVVVQYPVGKGTAIWWASSTPLENISISRGQDLELLLNSLGPAGGSQVYWDESLHAVRHTQWDFVHGPIWPLFVSGSLCVALLTVFSFSRRRGPLRTLPHVPRTTPIEFLEALGALYRSTGAASTALQIAWERFRSEAAHFTGQRTAKLDARQLADILEHRFGAIAAGMNEDLIEIEAACQNDQLKPRRALEFVQILRKHEETLRTALTHTRVRPESHPKTASPAATGVTLGT